MNTLLILAGGMGSRMNTNIPKCAIKIIDKSMLDYVIDELKDLFDEVIVVLGYKNEFFKRKDDVKYVIQYRQLGSGHAVKISLDYINNEYTLIIPGDSPSITKKAVKELMNRKNDLTFLSRILKEKDGYGRVFNNKIVEQKELIEESDEVNLGVYYVKTDVLKYAIKKLKIHDEYYLSDIVSIINEKYIVDKVLTSDNILGVNNIDDLNKTRKIIKDRIKEKLLLNGNFIYDYDNTYISIDAYIKNTIIFPNTYIYGKSNIINSEILEGSKIINSSIFNCTIDNSTIKDSKIECNGKIGPYSNIIESVIDSNSCIGNFTEIKRSRIGSNFNARHLAYISDSIIMNNVNIGCGVITSNFNGVNKNKIVIGKNVFIGSNTNLIAPLIIRDNSYISSMCSIKENVDENTFIKEERKIIKKRNMLNE